MCNRVCKGWGLEKEKEGEKAKKEEKEEVETKNKMKRDIDGSVQKKTKLNSATKIQYLHTVISIL